MLLNLYVGDLWMCTATGPNFTKGTVYEYTKDWDAASSKFDYHWVETTDKAVQFKNLFDISDGKGTIHTGDSVPSDDGIRKVKVGDLWIPSKSVGRYEKNTFYVCSQDTAGGGIVFQLAQDKRTETFVQDTIPTGRPVTSGLEDYDLNLFVDDLWLCTNNVNIGRQDYSKGTVYVYTKEYSNGRYYYKWLEDTTGKADTYKGLFDLADGKKNYIYYRY